MFLGQRSGIIVICLSWFSLQQGAALSLNTPLDPWEDVGWCLGPVTLYLFRSDPQDCRPGYWLSHLQGGNSWTLTEAEKMRKHDVLEANLKLEHGPNVKGMRLIKTYSKLIAIIHYFKIHHLTY